MDSIKIGEDTSNPQHLSPAVLAVVSMMLGMIFIFMPKSVYEDIMDEPDLMVNNSVIVLFVLSCVLAFIAGYLITRSVFHDYCRLPRKITAFSYKSAEDFYKISRLGAFLVIFISFTASAIFVITKNVIGGILSGNAESFRDALVDDIVDGGFSFVSMMPLTCAMCFWLLDRFLLLGNHVSEEIRSRWGLLISVAITMQALEAVVTLQRSVLLPFIIAIVLIYSARKWHPSGVSLVRAIRFGGLLTISIVGLFLFIALFRDSGDKSIFYYLFGYVPASYNRLAATISGDLVGPFPDRGFYSFHGLIHPPLIRRIFPVETIAEFIFDRPMPASIAEDWLLQFKAVGESGLIPLFIWPTAFGYTFFDFGWNSYFYFFGLGCFGYYIWYHYLYRRSVFGVVTFPFLASSILLWSTSNLIASASFVLYLGAAFFISQVEKISVSSRFQIDEEK